MDFMENTIRIRANMLFLSRDFLQLITLVYQEFQSIV